MGKRRNMAKIKRILNIGEYKKAEEAEEIENEDPKFSAQFILNHHMRPPYHVLLDTNFVNDSVRKKFDPEAVLMQVLNANVRMCVTDCVIAELEKLGRVYRVALSIVKSDKVKRLVCDHRGTYADDCILSRVSMHRCYIVATADTALRQRIKAVPGVPLITYRGHRCIVERFMPPML
jgi:U3 small nucleolar RNA-associated protein 24